MKSVCRLAVIVCLVTFAFSQTGDIVPNENLVVQGVPKIPASLADAVDRYTNFSGATLDGWDPLKLEMLISTRLFCCYCACDHVPN